MNQFSRLRAHYHFTRAIGFFGLFGNCRVVPLYLCLSRFFFSLPLGSLPLYLYLYLSFVFSFSLSLSLSLCFLSPLSLCLSFFLSFLYISSLSLSLSASLSPATSKGAFSTRCEPTEKEQSRSEILSPNTFVGLRREGPSSPSLLSMYIFPLSSLFFYLSRSPSLKETGRALSLSFSFV